MPRYIYLGLVASVLLLVSLYFQPAPASSPSTPGATCHIRGQLPDAICTPGSINMNVTQANINQTICVKGWTATVRPSVSYTNALKIKQMAAYGFTGSLSGYEEDHLIPLELAGNPTDPKNLWPEPGTVPNPKDSVENQLRQRVCSGAMQLSEAQRRIANNWQTALKN